MIGDEPPLPAASLSSSLNGSTEEVLNRYMVRELMEGWVTHRDACEWSRLRNLFTDEGYVFTTWSAGRPIDEFIKLSSAGFKRGDFIMHRMNGSTVDIAASGPGAGIRAIGKMKATITQRFIFPALGGGEAEADVEGDGRIVFFCLKTERGWKARWFKLFYEKDKIIPVDPAKVPALDYTELSKFPSGYKHLGYAQQVLGGHKVLLDLPQREGEAHEMLYKDCIAWLEGKDVEL
ncbi:putative pathogenesis associated protein Pep2 [Atractiella rhizophila]|nr:putative pathogenesis associated protein Pep2 [Atractiella rhizophila]